MIKVRKGEVVIKRVIEEVLIEVRKVGVVMKVVIKEMV